MRAGILKLLIASILFVSMEGVADSIDEASFHQTHHAHAEDAGDQWFPDSDGSDHEGESCEHFCHAHVVALTTRTSLPSMPMFQHDVPVLSAHSVSRSTAPPTPPPNL